LYSFAQNLFRGIDGDDKRIVILSESSSRRIPI
jgi:hypothetical protein